MIARLVMLAASMIAISVEAHVDHDHQMPSAVTIAQWEKHLVNFQRTGDGHDLSAAATLLDILLQEAPEAPDRLYLAARTAQAGHRFDRAQSYLEKLFERQPHHSSALLLAAGIWLVQGNHVKAAEACAMLNDTPPIVMAFCHSQSQQDVSPVLYRRLVSLIRLSRTTRTDKSLIAWGEGMAGDVAARLDRHDLAESHFRNALRVHSIVRYRASLADALLKQDRPAEVMVLLDGYTAFGLRVKRLVALKRLRRLDATSLDYVSVRVEIERMQRTHDYTHGREMAEFYVDVVDRPAAALTVLEAYLPSQREAEDLDLLRRATAHAT